MYWLTLALLVVAITQAGVLIAVPFGREPGNRPAATVRVFSNPHAPVWEILNGR